MIVHHKSPNGKFFAIRVLREANQILRLAIKVLKGVLL